jgi:hypothetical protein
LSLAIDHELELLRPGIGTVHPPAPTPETTLLVVAPVFVVFAGAAGAAGAAAAAAAVVRSVLFVRFFDRMVATGR